MIVARLLKRSVLAPSALALVIGIAGRADATTIYQFDALSRSPTTTTANTTASNLLGWEICTSAPGVPTHSCGVFGDGTMSIIVTPNAGYTLSVTGFSFDELNQGVVGPTAFNVFTSADGFASPILSGALAPSAPAFTNHSTSLALSGLTGPFEIRIISNGEPPLSQSAWLLDNITLQAVAVLTPTAVPEPATLLLIGAGVASLAARRRSKNSAKR